MTLHYYFSLFHCQRHSLFHYFLRCRYIIFTAAPLSIRWYYATPLIWLLSVTLFFSAFFFFLLSAIIIWHYFLRLSITPFSLFLLLSLFWYWYFHIFFFLRFDYFSLITLPLITPDFIFLLHFHFSHFIFHFIFIADVFVYFIFWLFRLFHSLHCFRFHCSFSWCWYICWYAMQVTSLIYIISFHYQYYAISSRLTCRYHYADYYLFLFHFHYYRLFHYAIILLSSYYYFAAFHFHFISSFHARCLRGGWCHIFVTPLFSIIRRLFIIILPSPVHDILMTLLIYFIFSSPSITD